MIPKFIDYSRTVILYNLTVELLKHILKVRDENCGNIYPLENQSIVTPKINDMLPTIKTVNNLYNLH